MTTLERTDDLPLAFDGAVVAESSSAAPGKDRWTELRLWELAGDSTGWVVEVVGLSTLPGEVTKRSAHHCATVGDVVACLRKSDNSRGARRSYLPDIAWQLLKAAHAAGSIQIPDAERIAP